MGNTLIALLSEHCRIAINVVVLLFFSALQEKGKSGRKGEREREREREREKVKESALKQTSEQKPFRIVVENLQISAQFVQVLG